MDPTDTKAEPKHSNVSLIPLAKDGDWTCAHQLLWTSARTLRRGGQLEPAVAEYLADALDQVADFLAENPDDPPGEAFSEAFNFPKRKRGRQVSRRAQGRDLEVLMWVRAAVDERGLKEAEAKLAASESFGIENVAQVLRRVPGWAFAGGDATTDYFDERGKPLPPKQPPTSE